MSPSLLLPNVILSFLTFFSNSQGEVPAEPRPVAEANTMAAFDRPPVIERLQNNVGKRKSTTPQKFVGGYFRHDHAVNGFLSLCQHP